jgi:Mn-containing catalase
MGALEPRHYLTTGLGATPADANGVPFSAGYVDTAGNLVADMRANVAAEAVGRTLAARLLEMTDPGMKDMLRFLIARDTMHQQQWLAVLEELGPDAMTTNAPGDIDNDGYEDAAYTFYNHLADREIDQTARFATGPSLDGRGEFSAGSPTRKGDPVELQKAPPEVHAGADSADPTGTGSPLGRFTRGVADEVVRG